ncbi:hypothetical protein CALCODRAFT_556828 [Calocera cornea HHB12733]|uniref:Exonuclease V n=1 Tax=Calocera cornea HHB12733 TaxID=1353952 RepID=A0A165EDM3_9BASI|nr:hypothetical protein CALCODRAFT_556828 [Calocera cornea HHB12733]
MSDDEYDLDFPALTDADLAQIDALSQPTPFSPAPIPEPEAAAPSPPPQAQPSMPAPGPSLLALFRSTRPLSVTDLTSPLWCEYQFSYSMLGRRDLPFSMRPGTIELPSGKEIVVNKDREKTGEKIKKKGSDVHKVLEREIHPVEVKVRAQTSEEYMGLRLVNMFTGVRSMLDFGYTREFPVFGYLHNQQITGIIDEIRRTAVPIPSESEQPSTQPSIVTFFSPTKPKPDAPPAPSHILRLLDHKTRMAPTLPETGSTTALAARLQLMLYKTLLDPLLARGPAAFDFESYFISSGLDEACPFGERFITSIHALVQDDDWPLLQEATCLRDMAAVWPRAVELLGANQVDDTLEVIYRLQPKKGRRAPKLPLVQSPPAAVQERGTPPLPDIIESDLPPDVVLLSSPPRSMPGAFHGPVDEAFSPDSDDQLGKNVDAQIMELVKQESMRPTPEEAADSAAPAPPVGAPEESRVLGSHKFPYSAPQIHLHIDDMLALWMGQRAPEGVDIEDVSRCWRCPYEDGCEWREMKAKEFKDNVRDKLDVAYG